MNTPSTKRRVAIFVLIILLSPFLWFGYAGMARPWRMTNAFLDVIVAGDPQLIRSRFAPDVRATVDDRKIKQWIDGVKGYSSWEFARKSSSMGTTRGGKSTVSQRGYLHYPNSADERYFGLYFIEFDGIWYVDSFSLHDRATPR